MRYDPIAIYAETGRNGLRTALTEALAKESMPGGTQYNMPNFDSLREYIIDGRPVGGFLTALLDNDLMETFSRADLSNQRRVYDYIVFLYNEAPRACFGSEAKRLEWQRTGGLIGWINRTDGRAAESTTE